MPTSRFVFTLLTACFLTVVFWGGPGTFPASAACPEGTCDTKCTANHYWYSYYQWHEAQMPIPYYVNKDGAADCIGDEFRAVQQAAGNWEDIHTTYWSTCYKDTTSKHSQAHLGSPARDSVNVVSWEDLGGSSPVVLGYAYVWYDVTEDTILEADMSLNDNAAVQWSALSTDSCLSGRYDVENLVSHEFGHWLYLGHSCDMAATMYCYSSAGETKKRTPGDCDFAGMLQNYRHAWGEPRVAPGCWPVNVPGSVSSDIVVGDLNRNGSEEVVYASDDGKIHVYKARGEVMFGWPQTLSDSIIGSPALGDVDADGWLEVVVGANSDSVYIFNHNGTRLANWPKGTGGDVKSTPAVGDIDSDGLVDVVCASSDAKVYAWTVATGNLVPGWPVTVGGSIQLGGPALADLDGDDSLDVVFSGNDYNVYAFTPHGANLSGWPQQCGRNVYERVAIGDIDGDSSFEVVAAGMPDSVYAWNHDGSRCTGWPVRVQSSVGHSAPSLGNLDSDPALEAVFGSDGDSLYAFNGNGTTATGWPRYVDGDVGGSALIADVDGDGGYEVVAATDEGKMHAFNGDGTTVGGWPKILSEAGFQRSPAIGDFNGDSELDVTVGSTGTGYLYSYSLGAVLDDDIYEWRMYGHDWNRTSRYGFVPVAPVTIVFQDIIVDLSRWDRWGTGSSFVFLSTFYNSPPYSMCVSGSPTPGHAAGAYSELISPDFTMPYTLRFAFSYDGFEMNNWIVFGHIRLMLMLQSEPIYMDIAGDWSNVIPIGSPFETYCFPGSFTQFEINVEPSTRTIVVYADGEPVASGTYAPTVVPSNRILIDDSSVAERYLYGFYDDFEVRGYLPAAVGVPERDTPGLPLLDVLYQSYPNPMNPAATISYSVTETGRVTLRVYDVAGRVLRVLVDEVKQASPEPYSVVWDGKNDQGAEVSSGVYFCLMETERSSSARKIVLLR